MKSKLRVLNPFRALRVKVTPDPRAMEALERLRSQLDYAPENGFHRDQVQEPISKRKQAQ